jgi:hypothetical protein
MRRRLAISEVRARLPELARFLNRSPHERVLIEHRDMKERLALVTERHLRYLESIVNSARRRRGSFKLAGSISSRLSDGAIEEALAGMAKERSTRARAKSETL